MSVGNLSARTALVAVGVLVSVALMAAPSLAAGGTKLCIPTTENSPVKTPLKNGTCVNTKTEKYTLTELGAEGKEGKQGPEGKQGAEGKEGKEGKVPLSEEEAATLKGILPCIKKVDKGIDEKPTVQFHGCNVQIVNGAGTTESTNGTGNLVIGYDELPEECKVNAVTEEVECHPAAQPGSHNLILGTKQEFTSFGSIIGGRDNIDTGPFSDVFGKRSTASGAQSSVTGGEGGTASGDFSSVTGGKENKASGSWSSVNGGTTSTASGEASWVGGGDVNNASGERSAIAGGGFNKASGAGASVAGGIENVAGGTLSSIGGGSHNEVFSEGKGGQIGFAASIFGGKEEKTATDYAAIP
jgi:hypothetical protein